MKTDPLNEILTTADRARREKPATNDDVPAPLHVTDPTTLQGVEIPPRKWLVRDWLPWRQTGLFYGDGGAGKSLLAQQLMTSAAVGMAWLGLDVEPCRTWGMFCEDDNDEMHRRQADINRHLGVDFRDLGNMRWISRTDAESNLLMTFDGDGVGHLTDLWFQVRDEAAGHRAQLVILDTAADTFGGNEINRSHVRQFIQRACSGLARELDGAVLLCAHPSAAGMSRTGDGAGGSTGWSNSARARWYLKRPEGTADEPADPDLRTLSRKKGNYARIGEELKLEWHNGVFRLVGGTCPGTVERIDIRNREREAEDAFLAALGVMIKQQRSVSDSPTAPNNFWKMFQKMEEVKGFTKAEMKDAMERLLRADRIRTNQVIGERPNRHKITSLAPTDLTPANDNAGSGAD
ncbi:AAA family ATPase [Azospirillum doebereinerae]|uniref:AAA family ATPase n=1 Tax=Azospirillum doebereinerae TaxID=92933 RepID=UPI001EE5D6CC|nr:AAA family ATPase [Azospirillum doebereinerae]MCG5240848.1 AAA family ATPase [Azospirillum doebereinerae]